MLYSKIVIAVLLLLSVPGCDNYSGRKAGQAGPGTDDTAKQKNEAVVYTCSMHHQIRSDKQGKCPICGMKLIPLEPVKQQASDIAPLVTLSARQQFLGNIHTDTAQLASLVNQLVLSGETIFDPRGEEAISARVSGWIEKMYVRNPGEKVEMGQKLYELYSPDLLSAEKEYLLAYQQKDLFRKASVDFSATIKAMKQKLLRWGLSESQIDHLPKQHAISSITIYSKTSGYLIQKVKKEGDHVKGGEVIMNLASNNTLWVQAQLYDKELPLLKKLKDIKVKLKDFPGKKLSGRIVFNNPVNVKQSRIHLLNIAIPNPNGNIQPGMLAYVYLSISKEHPNVVIPKSAVIYEEESNYVWIARSGNQFERYKVKLGTHNNSMIQVLHGIKPGATVVSSGAYLINSEYILQYGTGVNLSGMQMSDMKMNGRSN